MAWTEEQKSAIEEKGTNILVSAAAGSGKTTVLVARIINKILNEHIDIDKILVATFTNPAASEMKQRIMSALYEKIDENPDDVNLQRQISLISRANISTIHSFCLNVMRNNFFELGISANFRVSDPTEIEIMKQEIIEKIFEDNYEEQDKDFLNLLDTYTTYKDDQPLKDLILKIYEFSRCVPNPEEWIDNAVADYDLKNINDSVDFSETKWGKIILTDAKNKIDDYILNLKRVEKQLEVVPDLDTFKTVISEDVVNLEQMKFENWDITFSEIQARLKWSTWPQKRKLDEDAKELKENAKAVRDDAASFFKKTLANIIAYNSKTAISDISEMHYNLESLKNLTMQFEKEFSDKKREKNLVDFSDIEHLALKLLVNEDGTPSEIAKKYEFEEILIDEYQDSNLVQEKILTSVSNGKNIFMVGDVKQSIYRFRQARPDLFMKKYDTYKKLGSNLDSDNIKIQLYKNFRSRENVLDITNLLFQNIMSKEMGEIDYTEEEYLNCGATFEEPKIDCNSEIYVIDTENVKEEENFSTKSDEVKNALIGNDDDIKNDLITKSEAIKYDANTIEDNDESDDENQDNESEEIVENTTLEARLTAKKIKELHSNGVNYKDIAILLRSTKFVAPIYEKNLQEEGIPTFSDTASEFLESIEINTIISLLKVIDNPLQDIPLVTVLRSPIAGFTDNELLEIRLQGKNMAFYRALEMYDNPKAKRFLELLKEFIEDSKKLSVDELIWKIYSETGYYHYVRLMPNGKLRQANLRKLFEKAKDYEKISFKGLFNFIIFIEKVSEQDSNIGAAKIIGENDDVVRIMSIHKSKGLEFPIVCICGIGKKFNMRDLAQPMMFDQELGIGTDYIKEGVHYPTLSKEAFKIVAKNESISEEMRVLYVALTRAKEKLILIGSDKKVAESLNKKIDELNKYNCMNGNKINPKLVGKYSRYLDWIELVYQKNSDLKINFNIIKKSELMNSKDEKLNIDEIEDVEEILSNEKVNDEKFEEINRLLSWKYKYEKSIEVPSKTSVTALKQELLNKQKIEAKSMKTESENNIITPARKGTLIHLALQKIENDNIENMIKNLNINKQEKEVLLNNKEVLEDYIKSELFAELKLAKEVHKEVPFYMNIPYKDTDEKILIQGVIDLYYISKSGELILVDYKTDNLINEEDFIERYSYQLDLYKQALEQALNKNVDKKYIYSTKLKKMIELK